MFRLDLHYVVVLLGKGKAQLTVPGPHEQVIKVVESLPVANTDILLLRLARDIKYTRYVKPTHMDAKRDTLLKEKCIAIGMENATSRFVQLAPVKMCPEGLRCFESKIKDDCKVLTNVLK